MLCSSVIIKAVYKPYHLKFHWCSLQKDYKLSNTGSWRQKLSLQTASASPHCGARQGQQTGAGAVDISV